MAPQEPLLSTLMSCYVAFDKQVKICDAQGSWGGEFVKKLYAKYPPRSNLPYEAASCKRYFAGDKMTMFWGPDKFAQCISTCTAALIAAETAYYFSIFFTWGATAPGLYAVAAAVLASPLCYNPWVLEDANACKEVLITDYDIQHGFNFKFQQWPVGSLWSDTVTYNVHINLGSMQNHEYWPFNAGKSTRWTKLQLVMPEGSTNPLSPFSLDEGMFTSPIQFAKTGLLGHATEVRYSPEVTSMVKGAKGVYGLVTSGCAPPILTFKVTYASSSQPPNTAARDWYGKYQAPYLGLCALEEKGNGYQNPVPTSRRLLSIAPREGGARTLLASKVETCYRRTVTLVSVAVEPDAKCRKDSSLGAIRGWVYSVPTKDRVIELKKTDKYAVVPGGYVSLSDAQALSVINCATSASRWMGYSVNSPGGCVPCPPPTSSSHRVAVQCPAGSNIDCCYKCAPGYLLWPHCYPPCGISHAYLDGASGGCKLCPSGTVQNTTSGLSCAPCSALVGPNYYATPHGCVSCSALSVAKPQPYAIRCEPCESGMYVARGTEMCIKCPSGFVLIASTATCSPCSPGTTPDDVGQKCVICARNTVASRANMTVCTNCPTGYQTLSGNRTHCVPCPPLWNASLVQYVQGGGCAMQCAAKAYVVTTPYMRYLPPFLNLYLSEPTEPCESRNGCVLCTAANELVGTYARFPDNCIVRSPCTNKPAANAVYTGSGTKANDCPWTCNAGYIRNGLLCVSCTTPVGFNASKHKFTSECNWDCKPGFYRSQLLDRTCPPCVDLYPDGGAQGVFARLRDYGSARSPVWLPNRCGMDGVVVAGAAVMFLRNTARYVYSPSGQASICGDGLLSAGEECDDGNTNNGDGCSFYCNLELASPPFDCDLIGSPCLRKCGWDGSSLLSGFTLPPVTSCANISFYDYAVGIASGVSSRLEWLQTHMLSCVCETSQYMQLPFSECNSVNKGCRSCLPGQYHQDFGLPRCLACGSSCPAGYTNDTSLQSMCGPDIKTSDLIGLPERDANQYIGCKPCHSPPTEGMNYLTGCIFACKASSLVSSSSLVSLTGGAGYYCSNASLLPGGACAGVCERCICSDENNCRGSSIVGYSNEKAAGYYWGHCVDGVGITIQPCNADALPPGAHFVGNADYGLSRGCPWECAMGWQLTSLGTCVECRSDITCESGYGAVSCLTGADGVATYYCQPCFLSASTLPPLNSFETWGVGCTPICAAGAYNDSGVCTPCTPVQCSYGEVAVACGVSTDSSCVPCNVPLPPDKMYVAAGSCDIMCIEGYYSTPDQACVSCAWYECMVGYKRSSDCIAPADRAQPPTCVPCAAAPEGAFFTAGCAWNCSGGYVRDATKGCAPCNASLLCNWGFELSLCHGDYECSPCADGVSVGNRVYGNGNRVYTSKGACDTACLPDTDPLTCMPIKKVAHVHNSTVTAREGVPPPVRRNNHSKVASTPWYMG